MWGLFFLTSAIVALSLFCPGFLVLRGFGVSRCLAFSLAPVLDLAAYVLVGIMYEKLGIRSSWATLCGLLFILAAILFMLLRFGRKKRLSASFSLSNHGTVLGNRLLFDSACLLGYVVFACLFAGALFVWYLESPDSYAQEFDNISHLGTIQSFVNSGAWSPFSSSLYSSANDTDINPLPGGGFYPTAWYSVAALAVTSMGVTAAFAENVANFVFVALILPAGSFAFMRVLFDDRKAVIPFGAFCTLLFAGFPWMIIFFGPLYPNLSAFCLIPAVAATFLLMFQPNCPYKQRCGLVVAFLFGLVSLALAQPNAIFTLAVLLAPFCIWRTSRIPLCLKCRGKKCFVMRVLFGAMALTIICAIWMACCNASFLASVVQHTWLPYADRIEAVEDALVAGFMADGSQIILAGLIIVGSAWTLWNRKYLWLSFSYAFACLIFVINGCSDGPLKHIVGGFWYTDPWRCGAMASLIGIFLATVGLYACWHGIIALVEKARNTALSLPSSMVVAVCIALFTVVGSTFPGIPAPGSQTGAIAFRSVLSDLHTSASTASVYDSSEQAFIIEVQQVASPDALIINVPDDGSAFAFAADGLRTYYRVTREYDVPDETMASQTIRNNLCDIVDSKQVQNAVSSIGARYVLQLDQGEPAVESPHLFTYGDGKKWCGIDDIRDDTPGFTVVLAEGDMRLYEIDSY